MKPDRDIWSRTPAPAGAPKRDRSRPTGAAALLAMQRGAGNRALGHLARKVDPKKKPPQQPALKPLTADQDLAFALKYVDDYYEAVRDLLNLKNEIQQQAIENFKQFGALKDPPSIADAVFAEIFNQVVGLIPGGKFVTAAVSAGVFAVQLADLERDLNAAGVAGVSIEDEAKRGPSEQTKGKVQKVYDRGKTAYDAGKAVVGAGLKAAEERAAASKAEAAAQENAAMQSGRITEWRKATELAQAQEEAVTDGLELAVRKGTDSGRLKEKVMTKLGPKPKLTAEQQKKLESLYELELYRRKLTLATETTHYRGGGVSYDSDSTELELVEGGKPSQATLRRIADLLGYPWMAMYPSVLAGHLKVGSSKRSRYSKPPGMELEPSRPGMGG